MSCRKEIEKLKSNIGDLVDQKIRVKGCLGRSKFYEGEGTVEKVYPNFFAVVVKEENDDCEKRLTYTYSDVLTKTVELMTPEEEGYKSILPENMGPKAKIKL